MAVANFCTKKKLSNLSKTSKLSKTGFDLRKIIFSCRFFKVCCCILMFKKKIYSESLLANYPLRRPNINIFLTAGKEYLHIKTPKSSKTYFISHHVANWGLPSSIDGRRFASDSQHLLETEQSWLHMRLSVSSERFRLTSSKHKESGFALPTFTCCMRADRGRAEPTNALCLVTIS